jgi:hypothetical protein
VLGVVGVVFVGALGTATVLTWRRGVSRRVLREYAESLQSFDPARRARAGEALVQLGLGRAAPPLLDHVGCEEDDRVRITLALAVVRRRADGKGSRRAHQLREWAAEELALHGYDVSQFAPALARRSGKGGAPLPLPAATMPEPEPEPPDDWWVEPEAPITGLEDLEPAPPVPEPEPVRWTPEPPAPPPAHPRPPAPEPVMAEAAVSEPLAPVVHASVAPASPAVSPPTAPVAPPLPAAPPVAPPPMAPPPAAAVELPPISWRAPAELEQHVAAPAVAVPAIVEPPPLPPVVEPAWIPSSLPSAPVPSAPVAFAQSEPAGNGAVPATGPPPPAPVFEALPPPQVVEPVADPVTVPVAPVDPAPLPAAVDPVGPVIDWQPDAPEPFAPAAMAAPGDAWSRPTAGWTEPPAQPAVSASGWEPALAAEPGWQPPQWATPSWAQPGNGNGHEEPEPAVPTLAARLQAARRTR